MTDLPSGWTEVEFGALNQFVSKPIDPADYPDEAFELYSVPAFPTGKPEIAKGKDIGSTKQMVAPGDVLVCKINPRINRVWMVSQPSELRKIASSEWIVMRAGGIYARYLRAFFSSADFRELLCTDLTGVGGSLTRAQPKRVATYEILLAPLLEQKRIADKLDALLARVGATRERLNRVPALLKRFRQSVLAAATSGELTHEWRGGEVGWEETTLGEVINPNRPLCYGVVQPGGEVAGGVSLIRVQDMENGKILVDELRTIAKSVDEEYRRSRIEAGDLLISVVGTIGRTAIVPSGLKANIARAIARITCKEGVDSRWVNAWLSTNDMQWWLLNSSKEVARKTLNLSDLVAAPIKLPPIEEQREIVRRVEALFALADKVQAQYEAAKARVDKITPALLAKAFRGELVPQDPDDEPAEQLLARLRAAKQDQSKPVKKGRKAKIA